MKKVLLLFSFLAFANLAFTQITKNTKTTNAKVNNQIKSDSISVTTFKTGNTWGYDIFLKGKLYIHQPNVPAMQGNSGFKTEEYAKKTAKLVVFKIKHHIIPPTVSKIELDSLGVK